MTEPYSTSYRTFTGTVGRRWGEGECSRGKSGFCYRWSPLDPGAVTALAPHDLVSFLQGAPAFAIFTFLFLFAACFLHVVLQIRLPSLKQEARGEARIIVAKKG